MAAFHGASKQKMDDRGRVHLPVRWSDAIAAAGELVLTAGPMGSLLLAQRGAWQKAADQIGDQLLTDSHRRRLRSLFVGHAEFVSPDKANRVLINEALRGYAGLGDLGAVMLVGAGQSIEIWAPGRWYAPAITA